MSERVAVRFIGPRVDVDAAAGRTVARVLDALRDRGELRVSFTGSIAQHGKGAGTLRFFRTGLAALGMALGPRGKDARLYLPIDSGLDLDCAVMLLLAARLRGYRVFLHHVRGHWLDQAESRVGMLDRLAGQGVVHVLPTEEQISRLRWVYRTQKHAVAAPPPVPIDRPEPRSRPPLSGRPLVLGVIVDIGPDPAVTDAMNTFVLAKDRAGDCRLIAVGTPVRQTHRKHLDDATIRYDAAVEDRGEVDEAGFVRFCGDIDALLLPARELHDPWSPQVITAMALGVPVIARASGCVRGLVGEHGGAVIDANADFPRKALRLFQSWQHDPATFDAARAHAAQRGRHIAELAAAQFESFLDLIVPRDGVTGT
jgi:hypothetical protein